MPDVTPGEGVEITVTSNLREVLAGLKEVEPALARTTRRSLRRSGDEATAEMRGILAQPPPGGTARAAYEGGFTSRGSRDQASAALRTQVQTSKRREGVRIVGSREPFAKSYNKRSWRHPVFGNTDVWVEQEGRPYFGSVVAKHAPAMRDAIERALVEALEQVKVRG